MNSESGKEQHLHRIEELNSELHVLPAEEGQRPQVDLQKALELRDEYIAFSNAYPQDTLAPVFLYEAGNISSILLQEYDKTIELMNRVHQSYPDHRIAPSALFIVAFMYEDYFQDQEKAREMYTSLIDRYPESRYAQESRFMRENLGRDTDEILEEILRQQEQQNYPPEEN